MPSGQPNEWTRTLRPPVRLTVTQATQARDLRRQHPDMSVEDIARKVGGDPEAVTRALGTLRTRLGNPRRVLNVSTRAWDVVQRARLPDESVHQVLDRLLGLKGEG